MPVKPLSHAQRLRKMRRAMDDRAYDQTRRKEGALKRAKDIRSSRRWQRVRAIKLAKTPMCEDPYLAHRHNPRMAMQVDHIEQLTDRPDLAFTEENLQSLCVACHAKKSAEERRS